MSPSSATHVCPITGTPLRPTQTISLEAAQRLSATCNDLANLVNVAEQCIAGAGASPAPARTQPKSKPPLNVSLMQAVDEWRDLIDEWATAYLAWVNPAVRLPHGNWSVIQSIITGKTIPLDKLTQYPEAENMYEALTQAVKQLRRLTHWDSKTWVPLGPCTTCDRPVSAPLGDLATQCHGCGTVIDVQARKLEVRQDIGSLWLTRAAAREAARIYAGKDIPDATIKTWVARDKIKPIKSADGQLFNVGQLIALASEQPKEPK